MTPFEHAPPGRRPAALDRALAPLLGSEAVRRRVLAEEITTAPLIREAVRAHAASWPASGAEPHPAPVDEPAPVWVLAAGWGSGSTLVQRLLMSSGELLIWGEPFDHAAPLQHLAAPLRALRDGWPPPDHFRPGEPPAALARKWVANLAPPPHALWSAHRAFLLRWLGDAARAQEARRWGLKEVRLTADHAHYLKWLFPRSRFVFVYRHLDDAYLSNKGVDWLSIWPRHRVSPVLNFAHHWRTLLEGFLESAPALDAMLVRYEDLREGRFDLDALAAHVGIGPLDASLLEQRLGSRRLPGKRIGFLERRVLHAVGGDLLGRLGYDF